MLKVYSKCVTHKVTQLVCVPFHFVLNRISRESHTLRHITHMSMFWERKWDIQGGSIIFLSSSTDVRSSFDQSLVAEIFVVKHKMQSCSVFKDLKNL